MTETALRYEYLIRAAHQVGRLEIPAAHADTFRALERTYILYRDNNSKEGDVLFEYAFFCGEIATNLSNAIWKFSNDYEGQLTEEDNADLANLEDLMIYPKMQEIETILETFEGLLRRHGKVV